MTLTTLHKTRDARYFVIDGISTVDNGRYTNFLMSYLQRRFGQDRVVLTAQPWYTGTRGGEILLALQAGQPLPYDWILQNRADHLTRIIIPALEQGKLVVQRRGPYSTFAFDRVGPVELSNRLSIHHRMEVPDLALILDAPAETAHQRLKADHETQEHSLNTLQTIEALTMARDEFSLMRTHFPRHAIHVLDVGQDDVRDPQQQLLALLEHHLRGLRN